MTYFFVCNIDGKTYAGAGRAITHEKAFGHTSFKIVEERSRP